MRPRSPISAHTNTLEPTDSQRVDGDGDNIISEDNSQPASETSSTPSSFSAQQSMSSEGSPSHGYVETQPAT